MQPLSAYNFMYTSKLFSPFFYYEKHIYKASLSFTSKIKINKHFVFKFMCCGVLSIQWQQLACIFSYPPNSATWKADTVTSKHGEYEAKFRLYLAWLPYAITGGRDTAWWHSNQPSPPATSPFAGGLPKTGLEIIAGRVFSLWINYCGCLKCSVVFV